MKMRRQWKYDGSENMSDLVSNNYRILLVMSRFGIGLGFGDKSMAEVCADNQVDLNTFLAVINMLLDEDCMPEYDSSIVSTEALLTYLVNSHVYFLEFRLPGIREELVQALGQSKDELTRAVIRYFDEYVGEVRNHMNYEDETVFPYVRSLLAGVYDGKYSIEIFRRHHGQVEARLTEFKQILIKYYPARSTHRLNSVLFNIFNCENDLSFHNEVEDRLLVPVIMDLERKLLGET